MSIAVGRDGMVGVMPSDALARREPATELDLGGEKVDLIRQMLMPGATDTELAMFVEFARRTGLDPFTGALYALPIYDSRTKRKTYQFAIGIDGYRLVAERSGKYEGQEGPMWKSEGSDWVDVWEGKGNPYAAKVGVWRKGARSAVWAVAKWTSYVQTDSEGRPRNKWRTMPEVMLAKCAEALALRRAFPREMSGLYAPAIEEPATSESSVAQVANADGEPIATHGQKGILHRLARELGWDDDERHRRAGVLSFDDLTYDQAITLRREWDELVAALPKEDEMAGQPSAEHGVAQPPVPPAAPPSDPLVDMLVVTLHTFVGEDDTSACEKCGYYYEHPAHHGQEGLL